ncbi:MAG TPA: 50S ribosomal protein L3 [Candidatus Omnitrophota bacterium]|nr:50S ribosomal protein L3 [Candidatus Omnitrophota bacterium]HRZ15711.1 50S ribosomal protein L3 [Candidatus Omnitrophota bacterium]
MTALLGKKIGMTQLFTEDGQKVSVSVIEAGPCPVLAVKARNIQVGFDVAKENALRKSELGLFKKINVAPRKLVAEVLKEAAREYKVGEELKADVFKVGDFVDVTGISKGKGFQGGMKRWHWHGGPATHGHTTHRRVGSIGSTTTPGRVWKGHHMPGHMGNVQVTTQNLRVVKVDVENNLLVIKGAVPGHNNSYVIIKKAKKKKAQ